MNLITRLAAAALACLIAVPAAAAEPLSFKLLFGPGCDSAADVKLVYAALDRLPRTAPMAAVVALFASGREAGIMCQIEGSALAEVREVETFVRASDGATMAIIEFARPDGRKTFSWRVKSEGGEPA